MGLASGAPITEFRDRRNVGTDERLALIVEVCRAGQHAHREGIIHRDPKSSTPRDSARLRSRSRDGDAIQIKSAATTAAIRG